MTMVPYNGGQSPDTVRGEYVSNRSVEGAAKDVVRQSYEAQVGEFALGLQNIRRIEDSITDAAARAAFAEAAKAVNKSLWSDLQKITDITNDAVRDTLRDYYRNR